ncbi:hypothetical protein Bsp3421_005218 [Burkholderia sp. FERM BP-3421]|jgi:hypothetical protein|uniref:hypothetical protein n=1 Tax=Burkholderia sp. FERM BP-3421 TaxID=1494466 RepID=UPI00235EF9F5|nr:hypothetical protein [Burkholderia sp. FERM BP-3421]WDD95061.1 hypothetical protein Bsp3421_005218 [Burkholderia sp. FERM BP-3421]
MRYTKRILALLLCFAVLPEKSKREFLLKMNEFMVMSPLQRRRAMQEWQQTTDTQSLDRSVGALKSH